MNLRFTIYIIIVLSLSSGINDNSGLLPEEVNGQNIISDYIEVINNNDVMLDDFEILFFLKEDLDKDGYDEIIIGVGELVEGVNETFYFYDKIYILSEKNEIELIGIIQEGYLIDEVKLIKLPDSSEKYVYCRITNTVNFDGFTIYLVEDKQLTTVWHSAFPAGTGFSEVGDLDGDGMIDSYREFRWGYDVLFYEIERKYNWFNNEFVLFNCEVYVRKYPQKLEEVILQYVSLTLINNYDSEDINERLLSICLDTNTYDIEKIGFNEVLNTLLEIEGGLHIEIVYNGNLGEVIVSNTDFEIQEQYKYIIKAIKIDDKWHIEDISEYETTE